MQFGDLETKETTPLVSLAWDVTNGIARRAWARNPGAVHAIGQAMDADERLRVTLPHEADEALLDSLTSTLSDG